MPSEEERMMSADEEMRAAGYERIVREWPHKSQSEAEQKAVSMLREFESKHRSKAQHAQKLRREAGLAMKLAEQKLTELSKLEKDDLGPGVSTAGEGAKVARLSDEFLGKHFSMCNCHWVRLIGHDEAERVYHPQCETHNA